MTYLSIALVISLLAHLVITVRMLRSWDDERIRWHAERQSLLERIQRPERIPAGLAPPTPSEPRDPERVQNYARIGQVRPVPDGEAS